jgi:hypothetical protein
VKVKTDNLDDNECTEKGKGQAEDVDAQLMV